MNILAADPGKLGGIALFSGSKFISANLMPIKRITIKEKRMVFDLFNGKKQLIKSGPNKNNPKMKMKSPAKYKNELDTITIHKLFQNQDIIIIEKQNPRPGNSAASSASTMTGYGKLLALAEISSAQLILVAPMTWKKHFDLSLKPAEKKLLTPTQYKQLSIQKANNLSGSNITYDGPADATCIGYHYLQTKDKSF